MFITADLEICFNSKFPQNHITQNVTLRFKLKHCVCVINSNVAQKYNWTKFHRLIITVLFEIISSCKQFASSGEELGQ